MTRTIISTISKNYANALMQIAQEQKSFDLIKIQLQQVLETLESSNDLRIVMSNSSISSSAKLEILDELFGEKIDKKLLNFLKIMVEKNRFSELEAVQVVFDEMLGKQANKKTVEIYSPIKLNFENKSNVLFKLEHKLGCDINPVWKIDKSLIGGLAFKIDDCVIDTSIRSKLENLSKNINR